jgi:hypothetical protein
MGATMRQCPCNYGDRRLGDIDILPPTYDTRSIANNLHAGKPFLRVVPMLAASGPTFGALFRAVGAANRRHAMSEFMADRP